MRAPLSLDQQAMRTGIQLKLSWIRTDTVFTLNRTLAVKSVGEVSEILFARARLALRQKAACHQPAHRS
jgi:hypothetical protein